MLPRRSFSPPSDGQFNWNFHVTHGACDNDLPRKTNSRSLEGPKDYEGAQEAYSSMVLIHNDNILARRERA